MNLKDLLDESGLQQDEWSLSKPKFGNKGQLEVIGWSGKRRSDKYYILKCSECCNDPELFGDGYFRSFKFSLYPNKIRKETLPCGCGCFTKWTEDQYLVLCRRKAQKFGMSFLGWIGDFCGGRTKTRLVCTKHGVFDGTSAKNLVAQNNTKGLCRKCGDENASKLRTKPTDYFIEKFESTGKFPSGTKFEPFGVFPNRAARAWLVYCPICDITYKSSTGSISEGKKSCGCNWSQDQKSAYINQVYDENKLIALKFGVSCNPYLRNKSINAKSVYTIILESVYTFSTVAACRAAEKECKESLICGVLDKFSMPDGWTETTNAANLPKIAEIYQKHGGVLKIK